MSPPIAADLRRPGRGAARLAGLGAARIAGPGGTDRRTDGRIAALLNAPLPYGGGLNNMVNLHTH